MRKVSIMPLIEKEIKSYTGTAIAYILTIFFIFIVNLWFFQIYNFMTKDQIDFRDYFLIFPFLFIILIPALTMRSFSEESRQGTLEVLVTLPLSEWQVVIGKFLSSFFVVGIIITISMITPLSLLGLGYFDLGVLLTQYKGLLLLTALEIAIGQYISSLSENQITTFLISASILLFINVIGLSQTLVPPAVFSFISWFSVSFHFRSFGKGLLDSRDVIYFLVLTYLFLYLNKSNLLFRKWR